jgi:indole-3-glycerol phosphate synthase
LLRRSPGDPLRLIAENKRKSPSAGSLSLALTPEARAIAYAEGGAALISVLCDEPFFGGSWDHIVNVRRALETAGHRTPILAKEFILDERQLLEAHACGADAVLFIVRILTGEDLKRLVARAFELNLEPLVEVATEDELAVAVDSHAQLIGVNARDLDTLAMDAARTQRVLAAIPSRCVPLYLSGLKVPADVTLVAQSRTHGALIGEALMRLDDPSELLRDFVQAAGSAAGNA